MNFVNSYQRKTTITLNEWMNVLEKKCLPTQIIATILIFWNIMNMEMSYAQHIKLRPFRMGTFWLKIGVIMVNSNFLQNDQFCCISDWKRSRITDIETLNNIELYAFMHICFMHSRCKEFGGNYEEPSVK